jgi:TolB protein
METSNYQIYRSDIDGSNIIRLTYSNENDLYPDASPDGKRIVFQRGDYNSLSEIYIMNIDGSNLIKLTNNSVYDGKPRFLPDSYKIVFCAWDDSPYPEIFTMEVDGENRTQITADPGVTWHHNPVYSPDGMYIYFAYGISADNRIIRMTADGNTWKDITLPNDFGYDDSSFDVSDDGSKLVVQTTEYHGYNKGTDIIIINSDGSNWTALTNGEDFEYFYAPSFNSRGGDNSIYFSYLKDLNSKYEIKRMDMDGNNIKTLISCEITSNRDESKKFTPHLQPNPAHFLTKLVSETSLNIDDISIFSITGQIIEIPLKLDNNIINLDISSISEGIYFVRYRFSNLYTIQKLIVLR